MEAVTFPDPNVVAFIHQNVVALRLPHDHEPLAGQFQIKKTPNLIILDEEGKEHHRHLGFLPPEEIIPFILLGVAKIHLDAEDFEGALHIFETLLKDYSRSGAAPEAIFLRGVSLYRMSNDPKPLKEAYESLQAEYAESEWTRRAYPYRLL